MSSTAPALAASANVDREEHKTFEVSPGDRLELRHGDGDVTIEPWDRDVIEVRVRYHAEFKGLGAGNTPDFVVDFEQSGDTVRVRGRESVNWRIGVMVNRRHEYIYEIKAPAYIRLNLEGDDGDVEIRGWRAAIECVLEDGDVTLTDVRAERVTIEAEDGDVELDGFDGALDIRADDGDVVVAHCNSSPLKIRSEDGDVFINDCRGDFDITVEDGNVDVRGASVSQLSVHASDGDVSLELAAASDLDLTVGAEDGNVSVDLAQGISAAFEIDTDDGSIKVPNDDWVRTRKDHRVTGEVGAAGSVQGRIRIETQDGNVVLR
jgi:DUF4097 and DUF4098 domain-containing protein YvlB